MAWKEIPQFFDQEDPLTGVSYSLLENPVILDLKDKDPEEFEVYLDQIKQKPCLFMKDNVITARLALLTERFGPEFGALIYVDKDKQQFLVARICEGEKSCVRIISEDLSDPEIEVFMKIHSHPGSRSINRARFSEQDIISSVHRNAEIDRTCVVTKDGNGVCHRLAPYARIGARSKMGRMLDKKYWKPSQIVHKRSEFCYFDFALNNSYDPERDQNEVDSWNAMNKQEEAQMVDGLEDTSCHISKYQKILIGIFGLGTVISLATLGIQIYKLNKEK